MIARFFIDRPIFAAVLSIVVTLTGLISLWSLPMAQYPEITPPSVQVYMIYPGASAQVVADTVAAPIEQQVNGVPGMLYMSSQSNNDGTYNLTVTFDVGTDLNTALVMVQNRVALALPQLPADVQRQGITIRKKTPDILMVVNLVSPDGRYDSLYLSNYATIHLQDELLRVYGVSDINYLGQRAYSMRVWLDPQKMAARGLNAGDVLAALRAQNVEAAAGAVGSPPVGRGLAFEVTLDTLGRLTTPEQFGDVVVKVAQGGGPPANALSAGAAATSQAGQAGGLAGAMTGPGLMTGGATGKAGSGPASTPGAALSGPFAAAATAGPATSAGGPATRPGLTGSLGDASGSTGDVGGTSGALATVPGRGVQPLAGGALLPGGLQGGGVLNGDVLNGGPVNGAGGTPAALPSGPSPAVVRLRDVARLELGAQLYNQGCTFDGRPSVGLAIHQLPGTNALDVAERVRRRLEELKAEFPDGVDYAVAFDTTPFVRESVMDVVKTLLEAVALVGVVVLVFLQNWRSALIPLIAVPVAVIGTFAVMAALGFSLNNISLFGLVLAIGIVVDDAIVVVENVERWLDKGEGPREAARKAMDEVTGPVIAIALVLCAVFVPCAFIGGITGRFFRQFAVTIAASTLISAFNSLTLSPALAALLLRPRGRARDPLSRLLDFTLGWFFRLFNKAFDRGTGLYRRAVGLLLRGSVVALVVYGGLLFLTYRVFATAPAGFVPEQDMGRLFVTVQLPQSSSLQRTDEVIAQIDRIARGDRNHPEEYPGVPGVAHSITVSGMSLVLSVDSSDIGTMFIILEPSEKRRSADRSASAIRAKLQAECNRKVKGARVTVLGAPPIPGLSLAGGFKLMVEDRGGLGTRPLQTQTDKLVAEMRREPGLAGVSTGFNSNTPQLYLDVDRTKAETLGVSVGDVDQAMQAYMGSSYVNNFNQFGRYWQVNTQGEGRFRNRRDRVGLLEVRNRENEMVPLRTLATLRDINGPVMVQRYNLYVAAPVTGNVRPGVSTGEAISAIDAQARESLAASLSTEWTEIMFLQIRAGNTAVYVFLLAVVFVFLALAALYESWTLPLAVILVVPMCLLCSLAGVLLARLSVDIFVQIGLVLLVGLACKNAILIVEFAQHLRGQGLPADEATLEASRLRLRPILMTSFAFILGVVPLVIATGAGAEMRRSLGTAVFSGMLGVTAFGVFLTPVFFYVIRRLGDGPVFTSSATRWAGSALLGGLAGAAVALLLARLGLRPLGGPWATAGCAAIGAALALAVPALWGHVRLWPRASERVRPAGPERGDDNGGPRP
jgi:multidrug efflux pump